MGTAFFSDITPASSRPQFSTDLLTNQKHACITQPLDRIATEVESNQPINYFNLISSGWQLFLVADQGCDVDQNNESVAPNADADRIIDDLFKSLDLDTEATEKVYSNYLKNFDDRKYFDQGNRRYDYISDSSNGWTYDSSNDWTVDSSNRWTADSSNGWNGDNTNAEINPILEILNAVRFALDTYPQDPTQKKSDYAVKLINGSIDRLLETNLDEIVDKVVFDAIKNFGRQPVVMPLGKLKMLRDINFGNLSTSRSEEPEIKDLFMEMDKQKQQQIDEKESTLYREADGTYEYDDYDYI